MFCWVGLGSRVFSFVIAADASVLWVIGHFCFGDGGFTFYRVVLASADVRHHAVHGSVLFLGARLCYSVGLCSVSCAVGWDAGVALFRGSGWNSFFVLLRGGLVSWVGCGLTSDWVVLV